VLRDSKGYKGKSIPDGDTVLTGKSTTAQGNPGLKGMPKPVEAGAKTPNPRRRNTYGNCGTQAQTRAAERREHRYNTMPNRICHADTAFKDWKQGDPFHGAIAAGEGSTRKSITIAPASSRSTALAVCPLASARRCAGRDETTVSGAGGRGGVLADDDTAHGWWFVERLSISWRRRGPLPSQPLDSGSRCHV